jgi:hypothetical protein
MESVKRLLAACLLIAASGLAAAQTRVPNPKAIEAGRRGWAAIRDSQN